MKWVVNTSVNQFPFPLLKVLLHRVLPQSNFHLTLGIPRSVANQKNLERIAEVARRQRKSGHIHKISQDRKNSDVNKDSLDKNS